MTRLEVRQNGPSNQTQFGDTFTVTINGTPYTAATGSAQMATGTANRNQLHSEFSAFLDAQLSPTYTVSSTVFPFIEIEAANAWSWLYAICQHLQASDSEHPLE